MKYVFSNNGRLPAGASREPRANRTSFLKDQLGKKIAADGLHFIDDPLRPRGMGSRPFDAEGCPVQTRKMVEDGVLQGWFLWRS